ncbi:MAG TPA: DNA polymerase domain-containing protein, partial [Arthrobacter bacterium]|nr:DNA polymerase domain-containing protein [Arthrobacter sp.]
FVDFNQNAKDRTVASAYSIRPLSDARVSTPLTWDEIRSTRPEQFTVPTVLERFADVGDSHAGIDDAVGTLVGLLALAAELGPAEKPPRGGDGSGRRKSMMPLIEVARTKTKPEALAALDDWKTRHADLVPALHPADVLIDGMRGSSSLWYRVRVNLQHVPEAERPPQEELIADYDPWVGREWPGRPSLNR